MEEVEELNRRYGIFRAAEFGLAGTVGFLVAEGVIVAGVYAMFVGAEVPGDLYGSPALITLDVAAFVIGVTVGFVVNERTTVRKTVEGEKKGARGALVRLARFQGVYAVGNAITIGVQLFLLAVFGLPPAVGNIFGAVAAFPVSYLISMRVVWKAPKARG